MKLDKEIIEKSFSRAELILPDLFAKFNSVLNINFPGTAIKLGSIDFDHQRVKLEASCRRVIAAIGNPSALDLELRALMRQAIFQKFYLTDYKCAASSLLFTIGDFLGPAWNDRLAGHWTAVFAEIIASISSVMAGSRPEDSASSHLIGIEE